MGLWEYVQWATDELRQRSGVDSFKGAYRTSYDHVASAAASGAEKARDAVQSATKPVEDACGHAWDFASRATGEADRVVRVEAPRWVAERMPEAEKRQQLLVVLKEMGIGVADVAISEGIRCVPGGLPLYRVIKKGAADITKIQGEGVSRPSEAGHPSGGEAAEVGRPEEVIGWFLRDGFKGGDFLDDLIVPIPTRKESTKKRFGKAD